MLSCAAAAALNDNGGPDTTPANGDAGGLSEQIVMCLEQCKLVARDTSFVKGLAAHLLTDRSILGIEGISAPPPTCVGTTAR